MEKYHTLRVSIADATYHHTTHAYTSHTARVFIPQQAMSYRTTRVFLRLFLYRTVCVFISSVRTSCVPTFPVPHAMREFLHFFCTAHHVRLTFSVPHTHQLKIDSLHSTLRMRSDIHVHILYTHLLRCLICCMFWRPKPIVY